MRTIAALCVLSIAVVGCGADGPQVTPTSDSGLSGPWVPEPLEPGREVKASIEAACRAAFEVAEDLPVRHPQDVIGAPLVLVDARGQSIVHAIFGRQDGTGGACWNGEVVLERGVRRADEYSLLLSFAQDPEPVPERELCIKIANGHGRALSGPDAPPPVAWTVGGRAGSAIASVTIETGDAGAVTPTYGNGWFLAWWPTKASGYAIVGYGRDGEEVARLEATDLELGFACSDDAP